LATVSAGISEALLTTAVGLAVAIVSVWAYNFFTTRIEELTSLMEDASGELGDRLAQANRVAPQPAAPVAHEGWSGGVVPQ
jgi:biopolymer transport protein ExbB/TolQ